MARLQILYLPSLPVGDVLAPRFALVVDQALPMGDAVKAQLEEFGQEIGAASTLVTPITLDVTQSKEDDDDPDTLGVITWDHREMSKDIADLIRKRLESPSRRDLLSRTT